MLRSLSGLAGLFANSLTTPALAKSSRVIPSVGFARINTVTSQVLLVQPRSRSESANQESLRLVETYSGTSPTTIQVGAARQRGGGHPATHFRKGILDVLKGRIEDDAPKQVIVDATLTGVQLRNLEALWGVSVLDRVGLIIEIFAQRARTREARLQVELAALEHRGSRLVRGVDAKGQRSGFGSGDEVVSARQRGSSGAGGGGLGGGSGAGESELQLQRQRLRFRRKALHLKIAEVQRTRQVQRSGRRKSGKPVVAVVGYTNAGKSSLIEALTGNHLGSEDKLFATLDTTMRSVHLPSGGSAILSDTVGFLNDLPTQLLTAFKGTLEEVVHADLLVHVVDVASPQARQQHDTVIEVLRALGATDQQLTTRMITVHNKVDLLQPRSSNGSEADIGGDSDGDDDLPVADSSCTTPGNSEHTQEAAAATELASSTLLTAANSSDSHPHRQQPQLLRANRYAEAIRNGEGYGPGRPTHICLEAPLLVSVVTEQGLLQLLQEVDRKVSFRTGLDMLSRNTRAAGQRLLTQNVVGPYRPPTRQQRAHQERLRADTPWQPTWNVASKDTLAQHIFLGK